MNNHGNFVKRAAIGTTFIALMPALSFAEIKEVNSERTDLTRSRQEEHPKFFDRVLCVDGLKIFQTVSFGYGDGTGTSVSTIQLYHDVDNKVVPVTCSTSAIKQQPKEP